MQLNSFPAKLTLLIPRNLKRILSLLTMTLGLTSFHSLSASIHLPLQDKYLYSQLEKLMVVSNATRMTKPFSLSYVKRQLEKIKATHPNLYLEIQRQLKKYKHDLNANGSVKVSATDDAKLTMIKPNELGNQNQSSGELFLSSQLQATDWLAFSAGASATNSFEDVELYNSYMSIGFDSIQIDLGYRSYWMSPFQSRAMLNSNNAKQTLSAVLFNPIPLEFGNFSYEVFLRQMEKHQRIRIGDKTAEGSPYILGTHISFEPLDGLTIGFNRTFQFGGRGNSITTSDIWDAFTDAVGSDNTAASDSCRIEDPNNCEFGNQRAAITAKFNFTSNVPFSIYGEYAGEDAASDNNFFLGNLAISFGLFFPDLTFNNVNAAFTYEVTEYQNAWHSHHIYRDGYRIDGVSSGHWGTNYVSGPEQTAGTSHYLKLELFKNNHLIETELYYHQNQLAPGQSEFPVDYSDIYTLATQYTNQNHPNWRYKLELGQNYIGESIWSGSIKWEF